MTRQKKIEQEKQIESLIYLFIQRRGYFSEREDKDIFFLIAVTLQCSHHKVKKVFWKNLYPNKNFREWLTPFTY
jgi:hypothetical protein